jgi:hypothetical protein
VTDLATARTADALRTQLADALVAAGAITTPAVERAVRAVPREAFVPDGIDLAAAYADDVVVTKRGQDGKAVSSISAPWLSLSTSTVLRRVEPGWECLYRIGLPAYEFVAVQSGVRHRISVSYGRADGNDPNCSITGKLNGPLERGRRRFPHRTNVTSRADYPTEPTTRPDWRRFAARFG